MNGESAAANQLFRTLFDLTGDGVMLVDVPTRVIRDANAAVSRIFGYSREQLIGMRTVDLVHAESLGVYTSRGGGEHDHQTGVGRRADGTAIDVEIYAREFSPLGAPLRIIVVRPITDQARAYQLLEDRVTQRTRELTGLLQVSRAVSSTLDLRPLLGAVLDQLAMVVEYAEASVMCVDGDELRVLDYRGPQPRESMRALRVPVSASPVFQDVLRQDGPVIAGSTLAVPLRANRRVIGQLRLEHAAPGFYTWGHADLALAIANQAAMAIANARLFEQAERRRHELEALYHAEEALYRTLEPGKVLEALLDAATALLRTDKSSVLLWDRTRQRLTVQAARGFKPETLGHMSYAVGEGISTLAATSGRVAITADAQSDPRISPRLRALYTSEGICAMASMPIKGGSEVLGVFNLQYCGPHTFTDQEHRLMQALAQRAVTALDNARTYAAERATRERLDVALEAGRMGAWEWDLGADTLTWSPRLETIHGLELGSFPGTMQGYLEGIYADDRERMARTIADSLSHGEIDIEYRVAQADGSLRWFEATGRAVRDAQGQPIGMHGVCQDITQRKDAERVRAMMLERERAAYEAQAALEERQRLARELHDSVSQALYGIALGTQTALAALGEDHDPGAARDALQYVHKLADASIAEMRSLILELRPETLEQEGLVVALERQVASLRARHALDVEADLGSEPDLPLVQKEALYRIAQEGVHNAVKHARASALQLHLSLRDHQLALEISDNGVGFDPSARYPGHLGLTSMRERAAAAGGTLDIHSARGHGTQLIVRLPTPTAA